MLHLGANPHAFWTASSFLAALIAYMFIYPLCLIRNIGKLSFASVLGMVSVFYILCLTIFDFLFDSLRQDFAVNIVLWKWDKGVLSALNTFILSFLCHTSLLPIIHEMKNPDAYRRTILISTTQTVVFFIYILTSAFGYLHFGENIQLFDNILVAKNSFAYFIAKFLFIIMNIVSFPLSHYPARLSLDWIFTQFVRMKLPSFSTKWSSRKNERWTFEALFLVTMSLLLGVSFESVLDVFDIFVPLAGSFLIFTLPGLCFLKERDYVHAHAYEIYLAYFSLFMGAFLFLIGTPMALYNFLH